MITRFLSGQSLIISLLITCLYGSLPTTLAQQRDRGISRVRRWEPNVHAPELYADKLKLQMSVANLPGAENPRSYWEASYELYFVPEAEYQKVLETVRRQSTSGNGSFTWNPTPDQFPNKLLLTQGKFKKTDLSSPQKRTYVRDNIVFKANIPDQSRTKFARLLTSYSVKIFDGKLNLPLYRSSIWLTYPFDDDPQQPDRVAPRTVVYANFVVSPKGELFASQLPGGEGANN